MLMEVGHYVEAASKDELDVFLSSGFEPIGGRGAARDRLAPAVAKITQGHSGKLFASVTPLYRKSRSLPISQRRRGNVSRYLAHPEPASG